MKSRMLLYGIAVFNLLFSINIFSQTNVNTDSLEKLLNTEIHDSVLIKTRISLISEYINYDTLRYENHFNRLKTELNEKNNFSHYILFHIGKFFEVVLNDYTNAIKYYELATQKAFNDNDFSYIDYESWLGYTLSKDG